MKRIILLISLSILSACGGFENPANSNQSLTQTEAAQIGTGTLNVTINGEDGALHKTLALGPTAGAAGKVRIVISNPAFKINNVAFKNISTYPAGTATATYALPAVNGYQIEAISYSNTTFPGLNQLKRYASSSFDMGGGGAAVSLTPTPINAKIVFTPAPFRNLTSLKASSSLASSYYNISSSGKTKPLGASWSLVMKSAAIAPAASYTGSRATAYTVFRELTTPQSYGGGTLYALGEFRIDSFYLKAGESAASFTYIYPNTTWGDPVVSQSYGPLASGSSGALPIGGTW